MLVCRHLHLSDAILLGYGHGRSPRRAISCAHGCDRRPSAVDIGGIPLRRVIRCSRGSHNRRVVVLHVLNVGRDVGRLRLHSMMNDGLMRLMRRLL